MNDLDETLGYDADHDDPTQYCPHGTWIGSWWGPDYLCQWCEDGISVEEMREIQARDAQLRYDLAEQRYNDMIAIIMENMGYRAKFATWLANEGAEVIARYA